MSKWEWKKLKDICVFIGDGDWIESKDQSSKGIRLIQTGNIGNGIYLDKKERSHYISETTFCRLHCTEIFPGDCLISRLPEPIGRACVIPDIAEKMITAVDCTIVRFCEFFAPNFFIYYAQSEKYFSDVKSESTGATRKRISRKNLENIKIPVPPLSEQKRIVKFLDEEFSKIETLKTNAETNLKNAKVFFSKKIANEFTINTEKLKQGWIETTVGDIADIKGGKRIPKGEKLLTKKTKHPYIRVTDFNDNGSVDLDDIHYISDEIYEGIKRYIITTEDAYVSIAGTIGKCGIIPLELNNANLTENACRLIFNTNIYNRFFVYFSLSDEFKALTQKETRANAMPKLSILRLSQIQIPLPPLSVQKEIVARLDKLSENVKRLEANYKQIIADCDELKKSILKKTFEGES